MCIKKGDLGGSLFCVLLRSLLPAAGVRFFVENGDAVNNYMLTNFACLQLCLEEGEDIPRALVVKCRIILQQALVCI